jgi:hypothetical protein
MRYTHYYWLADGSTEPIQVAFIPADFKDMGLMFTSIGMPCLEAFELVNKWNKYVIGRKYWL